MQPKRGKFEGLVVPAGQDELVQGALSGARVERDGTLTVQGALTGAVDVAGVLLAQGALTGNIMVAPGGVAVLQGVIMAEVQNEGIVALEAQPVGATVAIVNTGDGRSTTVAELPDDVRRKLPTVTSSQT